MPEDETEEPAVDESDGPPDEIELSEVIEAEIGRFVHHPRAEAARLKRVAADGDHGTAPYIEMALVARVVIPLVVIVIVIALLVYFYS